MKRNKNDVVFIELTEKVNQITKTYVKSINRENFVCKHLIRLDEIANIFNSIDEADETDITVIQLKSGGKLNVIEKYEDIVNLILEFNK